MDGAESIYSNRIERVFTDLKFRRWAMDDAGYRLLGVCPDPVECAQYHRKTSAQLWESAPLARAMLQDAIDAYLMRIRKSRINPELLHREAESWILADHYDHAFSFNNVCDRLGVDPEYLRRRLQDLWQLCGPHATDRILSKLSPFAHQISAADAERAVKEAFYVAQLTGRNRQQYLARYTLYRIEHNVLRLPKCCLEDEWKRRGFKDFNAFTRLALTRPIPVECCEKVVHLLIPTET